MTPTLLCPTNDRCGEGAVWSANEQALYWADINRFIVHQLDYATMAVRSWAFDEPVVAVALTEQAGTLLLALGSHLMLWSPHSDRRRPLPFKLKGSPKVRLNDARVDPRGQFWVGSMQNNVRPNGDLDLSVEGHWTMPGMGTLFRISEGGTGEQMESQIGISNTLCWSPDQRNFYFGDTLGNTISVYDYDSSHGTISNRRPFFAGFDRGGPDGSAMDRDGYLWNCRFGGGCVVRIAPDGTIDRIIEMPCTDVTTCTFGGPDLRTLFITTAGMRMHPGERLAGSVFGLEAPVPGIPETAYKINPTLML